MKYLLVFMAAFFLWSVACEAQQYKRSIRNPERQLFGKSLGTKQARYKESPSVVRAKKKQAANQKKIDREYTDYVKSERKRAVRIQTPEVQDRMIQNRKDAELKYKEKKKRNREISKKASRKYD